MEGVFRGYRTQIRVEMKPTEMTKTILKRSLRVCLIFACVVACAQIVQGDNSGGNCIGRSK